MPSARVNFMLSLAAYSVVCYLLQVMLFMILLLSLLFLLLVVLLLRVSSLFYACAFARSKTDTMATYSLTTLATWSI